MSNNVLSIIDVVFGKFKRKFHNKIRPFEPYMHEPTISNKNNICYDKAARYVQMIIVMKNYIHALEIQTGVYVVIAARWKHQQKVFVVVKC